jgi:hypothetical protein
VHTQIFIQERDQCRGGAASKERSVGCTLCGRKYLNRDIMAGVCEGAIVECGKWTDPISLHLSPFYSEYSKSRMTLWKKMWGECNLIRDGGVVTYAR